MGKSNMCRFIFFALIALGASRLACGLDIHYAAMEGDVAAVKAALTDYPELANVKDENGYTPLYWAATIGHREVADILLAEEVSVDVFSAAALGLAEELEQLLKADPSLAHKRDFLNRTPLHMAATKEVAKILIAYKADIGAKMNCGTTPLQVAAATQRTDVVDVLITHGATIDIFAACALDRQDTVKVMLEQDSKLLNARKQDGSTPLFMARSGAMAQQLIEAGANVNARSEQGFTPLHMAVFSQNTELAQTLVTAGALVNTKDAYDFTPLYWAASKGLTDVAEILIKNGATTNQMDSWLGSGPTPLYAAAQGGHADCVKLLLDHGAKVDVTEHMDETPLFAAGNEDVARLLIEHGADVNRVSETSGWTPMHMATDAGVARVLVEHGADVNAIDKMGRTPLDMAKDDKRNDVILFLQSKGAQGDYLERLAAENAHTGWQPENDEMDICKAASMGLLNKVREYVDNEPGLVSASCGCANDTPLHRAATAEVAALLIEKGADVNDQSSGEAPLHTAADRGRVEVVELLIARGADVNAKRCGGETPLHEAVMAENAKIVQLLLAHGADVNAVCNGQRTALSMAAQSENKEIGQMLVDAGANTELVGLLFLDQLDLPEEQAAGMDIHQAAAIGLPGKVRQLLKKTPQLANLADPQGNTPLHLCYDRSTAKVLIEHEANVDAVNNDGLTPLHYAVARKDAATAELLLAHEADLEAQNDRGLTPLLLAAMMNHEEMARLLRHKGAKVGVIEAAALGDLALVKSLVQQDPSMVSQGNLRGQTALHWAGSTAVAAYLIEHGAGIDVVDVDKRTPLLSACEFGHWDVVKALLERGADATQVDAQSNSCLLYAVMRRDRSAIELLLDHNVDVDIRNADGYSPLRVTAIMKDQELANLLLSHGADPDELTAQEAAALGIARDQEGDNDAHERSEMGPSSAPY